METKQHATKTPRGQWYNKFKNTLRQMIMKTWPYKIYGMHQKQFLEGRSQWYRSSQEKNKKNLKQPNLPPKRIRKRATGSSPVVQWVKDLASSLQQLGLLCHGFSPSLGIFALIWPKKKEKKQNLKSAEGRK